MKLTKPAYALDEFAATFRSELPRLLVRTGRYKVWQIDEVCQEELVTLLVNRTSIEARHRDGAHYARARAVHAGLDFERRERGQCCHGVRLKVMADGTKRAGRKSVSLNAELGHTDRALVDRLGATKWEDDLVDRLDCTDQLAKALVPVSTGTRVLMWDALAMGETIGEAAQRAGIRRETANRKISAATKAIQAA